MASRSRKLLLAVHVLVSVGWLGATLAYLALAITGLVTERTELARAAYLANELIAWFVIVPLCVATWLVGVAVSLTTGWGLIRYWWVVAKLVLTTVAAAVLLQHVPSVSAAARLAEGATFSMGAGLDLRTQLLVHAAGGLLVLVVVTVLSVLKPWGLTPYGARQRTPVPAPAFVEDVSPLEPAGVRSIARRPRWKLIVGIHGIVLVLLFLVLHVAMGGMHHH